MYEYNSSFYIVVSLLFYEIKEENQVGQLYLGIWNKFRIFECAILKSQPLNKVNGMENKKAYVCNEESKYVFPHP